MASKSGRAGVSTHDLAERRSLIGVGFGVVALAVLWVFFKALPHAHPAGLGAIGVLVIAFLVIVFKVLMYALEAKSGTKTVEEEPAISGVESEERVVDILGQLGGEHLIIHDVRCQFGTIDHIVLSKSYGVFLIETKAHEGRVAIVESKIRVNGKLPEADFIAETLHNSYWLVEELETITGVKEWVNPLIVFTNAFVVKHRPIKDIAVTNRKFLLENLRQLGKPLSPHVWEAREKIAGLLVSATATSAR